jgi:glycosyltransferase involved in cell wall biosynthesis
MKIAILICTRNRPVQLDALLQSISRLDLMPEQVVISSSGQDVADVILRYLGQFKYSHIHTDLYGQIRQKMLGIAALEKSIEWTIFLDDDVALPSDTLSKLRNLVELRSPQDIMPLLGVGFKTPSTSQLQGAGRAKKLLARIFFLDSRIPGKVLASGHPVQYVNSINSISTQWLNGISAWNSSSLHFYGSDFLESRYSAFEDVIFSYGQGKLGELVYAPNIQVNFQSGQTTDLSNVSVFKAATFWRLKFVLGNPEFSRIRFLWSQVGRSLFFSINSRSSLPAFANSVFTSIFIYFEVAFQLLLKRDANWSLSRHCK